MSTEKKFNLIENYLAGLLSEQEQESFEKQLQEDPQLREELNLHQQVANTLRGEKVHQFRQALKKTNDNWKAPLAEKTATIKRFDFRKVVGIAAAILLLVLAYQIFLPQKSLSDEALFAANFDAYKMVLNQRSAEDNSDLNISLLQEAINSYEQKNFATAADAFQKLQTESPDIIAFQFYRGLSALALKNTDSAISILKNILEKPNHLFIEQSRWYLALAYLQKGERTKAKAQLQAIPTGAYQYEAAKNILRSMD